MNNTNSNLMDKLYEIAHKDAETSNMKRENANVNGNSSMGQMLQYGSASSKALASTILKEEHINSHINGDIHIHDMDFVSIGTATCLTGDTTITIKDKNKRIARVGLDFFDVLMMKKENIEPELKYLTEDIYVLGRYGWTKIVNVMRRMINHEKDKLFLIETHDGSDIVVTDKHQIPIIVDDIEYLVDAGDILIGDGLLKGLLLENNEINNGTEILEVTDITRLYNNCYVYDLETEEHWFTANGYIVHNCNQINLDKLFNNGFSTGHGFLREPQSIRAYASLAAIAIQANQNDQHGGQSIPCFDYYLSDGVTKSYIKKLKSNASMFIDIMFGIINNDKYVEEIFEGYGEIESIDINDEKTEKMKECIISTLSNNTTFEPNLANNMVDFMVRTSLNQVDRETYQAMEAFVHNLNTMNSRAGSQTPFSSINFGTDTSFEGRMVSKNLLLAHEAGLGKGETPIFPILIFKVKSGVNLNKEDPNYDLFKLACRVSSRRMFPNFAFLDAPFNLKYYEEGNIDSEIAYMGCRTRTIANVCGDEVVTGRGNISFTSINLPRLAIKHGLPMNKETNLDNFYEELDEWFDIIIEQLLDRFYFQGSKKVMNFPFLMGQGLWTNSEKLNNEDEILEVLKEGSLSIGFIGLAEALIALTGSHHGESEESQMLGLQIVQFMRDKLDKATEDYNLNFALLATPAEGLSGRFLRIDREKYGEIKGVTDKEYYTNSFHIPVYYQIPVFKKISLEAPYHSLTNGGHISYIELDGDVSQNLEAFEKIIKYMATSGIGYGSINHPIDKDPVCGYQGVIYNECPLCGRKESEDGIPFERIRRITGYLTGTIDRFNDAKKAEEKDRVKHG